VSGSGGGSSSSSSPGVSRRHGGGDDRGGGGHANNHPTGKKHRGYDAYHRIDEIHRTRKTTDVSDNDDFPAYSSRLRAMLLPQKFKPLTTSKYALAIENAGSDKDTKCHYFPFCLDQAPLTWLESLAKNSIDEWDHLKAQFTSNFAGSMGNSGTRMDLAMIKQKQCKTLRQYMRHFNKHATVVDVTDKEVIDCFQDGLYHHCAFKNFGRRRPSSITKLKDMITSRVDEEDKANAKYDSNHSKGKNNTSGNNNKEQGVATTTTIITWVLAACASQITLL
jgi:hypothetical protein